MTTKQLDRQVDSLIALIDLIEEARRQIVDREAVERAAKISTRTSASSAWRY